MFEQELARENLIIKTITGSRLYGTENESSDLDFQGIFIPSKQYVYGLHSCDQVILQNTYSTDVVDYTCYSLVKFVKLARASNPNIISLFYTPKDRIVFINKYGEELIKNVDLFISKKAYHAFRGYAHAQKRKIITKQAEGKRKELIDKYNFDVKFSLHLIRLYMEILDILTIGKIVYPLANRGLLKQIRNGEKTLDWVLAESDRYEHLIDEAYIKSSLQYSSDDVKIEQLQMEMLEDFWKKGELKCLK